MIIAILIISLIVIFDQFTKILVRRYMYVGEPIKVIGDFFTITSHRNEGAAWSVLEGNMTFFYIITLLALPVMGYFLYKAINKNLKWQIWGLSLAIGGTVGNFIDRLFFKEVTDFLDFVIFGYDYPTFNIADMALVAGMIVLAFEILIFESIRNRKTTDLNDDVEEDIEAVKSDETLKEEIEEK